MKTNCKECRAKAEELHINFKFPVDYLYTILIAYCKHDIKEVKRVNVCFEAREDLVDQCAAACANPNLDNCGNCRNWNWDTANCEKPKEELNE